MNDFPYIKYGTKTKMIESIHTVSIGNLERVFLKITNSINWFCEFQLRISWYVIVSDSYEQEVSKFLLEVRILNWQNVSGKKKNDSSHWIFFSKYNMEAEKNRQR